MEGYALQLGLAAAKVGDVHALRDVLPMIRRIDTIQCDTYWRRTTIANEAPNATTLQVILDAKANPNGVRVRTTGHQPLLCCIGSTTLMSL
jgi:hypothetical protein